MNLDPIYQEDAVDAVDTRPILIIPYVWIGDFVRGHTVVRVLKQRWPNRPVDLLATSLCAPLVDYMPGVRAAIVCDLPRSRLAVAKQWELAAQLRAAGYGTALVLPRTWKSAVALAPGSVGASKRWTYYAEAARLLAGQGLEVWVVGGPGETALAAEIVAAGGPRVRDLTDHAGTDLRSGIVAMAAASVAISNDSGLMHIAAALGTPTMGIFGPTSPYHWAPLNGLAARVQTKTMPPCQPCHRPVCSMNEHRCMRDIAASDVAGIAERVLAATGAGLTH